MSKRRLSIKDLSLKDQKVLMRVDFNVPLEKSGAIRDDSRIKAAIPSIQYVLDKGGSVILMSHLGRPKGKDKALSLEPCQKCLAELLKKPVRFAKDCIGEDARDTAKSLQPGEVLLLENLRFYPAEERPEANPEFAKTLASLGTVYIDDAFGCAHRAHASITEVPKYFPGKAASGLLVDKELEFLEKILKNPKKPFIALIGGAKVSTKIGVLRALLPKVDALLIGGGMAYTFMRAEGQSIGKSLVEEQFIKEAASLLKMSRTPIFLPVDHVIADAIDKPNTVKVVQGSIPEGFYGVDIGPKTIELFIGELQKASTIFWNGPLGIYENKQFCRGTLEIAKAIADSKTTSVLGGGDSAAAINEMGLSGEITHISTGGGATLEYIEKGTLPGIETLNSS